MSAAPNLSEEQVADVLVRMGDGPLTLKAACKASGLSYGNVRRRIAASDPLKALYAEAREDYAQSRVETMYEIAEEEKDVVRARLKIDVIKWEVSKVSPKVYGDKLDLDVKGTMSVKLDTGDGGVL